MSKQIAIWIVAHNTNPLIQALEASGLVVRDNDVLDSDSTMVLVSTSRPAGEGLTAPRIALAEVLGPKIMRLLPCDIGGERDAAVIAIDNTPFVTLRVTNGACVVVRVGDVVAARACLSDLEPWTAERHGEGPMHFSSIQSGTVVEIYPRRRTLPECKVELRAVDAALRFAADGSILGDDESLRTATLL